MVRSLNTHISSQTYNYGITYTHSHAVDDSQGQPPAQSLNVVSFYLLFQVDNKLGAPLQPPFPSIIIARPSGTIYCTISGAIRGTTTIGLVISNFIGLVISKFTTNQSNSLRFWHESR